MVFLNSVNLRILLRFVGNTSCQSFHIAEFLHSRTLLLIVCRLIVCKALIFGDGHTQKIGERVRELKGFVRAVEAKHADLGAVIKADGDVAQDLFVRGTIFPALFI